MCEQRISFALIIRSNLYIFTFAKERKKITYKDSFVSFNKQTILIKSTQKSSARPRFYISKLMNQGNEHPVVTNEHPSSKKPADNTFSTPNNSLSKHIEDPSESLSDIEDSGILLGDIKKQVSPPKKKRMQLLNRLASSRYNSMSYV